MKRVDINFRGNENGLATRCVMATWVGQRQPTAPEIDRGTKQTVGNSPTYYLNRVGWQMREEV